MHYLNQPRWIHFPLLIEEPLLFICSLLETALVKLLMLPLNISFSKSLPLRGNVAGFCVNLEELTVIFRRIQGVPNREIRVAWIYSCYPGYLHA